MWSNNTYTYTCRNIFNSSWQVDTVLSKNIPLILFRRVIVWEVSWRLNRTATYWPPQLFWLSQPFFPVPLGCTTGGLGAQPLLGHGSHSCIFSPTDLNFLSPGLYNDLMPTYFLRASQFAFNSTPRQSRSPPDIFDRMHLLFTQVYFLFWQLGQGQYVTQYSAKTITDAEYTDLVLYANAPAQAESLLHCLEQAARGIGLNGN